MNTNDTARFRLCLLLALGLVSLLGAWSYQQLEPPGDWDWVETEVMPGGTICVCYHDTIIFHTHVAWKDSVWHHYDFEEWGDTVARRLTISAAGKPAVVLESDTVTTWAVMSDTSWNLVSAPYRIANGGHGFVAFDSSGNPALMYLFSDDLGGYGLASASESGGSWTTETLELGYDDGFFGAGPVPPTTLVLGPGNRFYDDRGHIVYYLESSEQVYVDSGRTGGWGHVFQSPLDAYEVSLALGPVSDYSVCYSSDADGGIWRFYCDSEVVESAPARQGKIRIDSRDIRQIVYRLDVMKMAYRTERWHIDTLPPEINAATSFDFAVDSNDMPLIAFSTPNGVFLATGDPVCVAEKPPQVIREPLRLPTIIRGTLSLPRAAGRLPLTIYDINGRKVMDIPHSAFRTPHSVDVSHLAPGVYFVRAAPQSSGIVRHAVQKVIIAR